MAPNSKTFIVIGSGPGNGRAVTTLFAKKRYNNVALIARRPEQLKLDKKAIEEAVGDGVTVKTYAVDVVDSDALLKVLDEIDAQLGKPECIFYNAARVLPSRLLTHDVKDIEYDFKVSIAFSLDCRVIDRSHRYDGETRVLIFTDKCLGSLHHSSEGNPTSHRAVEAG